MTGTSRTRIGLVSAFTGTVAAAALASSLVMPAAQAGTQGSGACTKVVTGALDGAQTVPTGEKLCLRGASVGGAITVDPGGALSAVGATVDGAITLNGAKGFSFCGSATTGGALSVTGSTGLVRIGDNRSCAGNSIDGAITVNSNVRAVKIARNDVSGGVVVRANVSAKGANPIISDNAIGGDLTCRGNDPKPTERGRPNVVTGSQIGQCKFGVPAQP